MYLGMQAKGYVVTTGNIRPIIGMTQQAQPKCVKSHTLPKHSGSGLIWSVLGPIFSLLLTNPLRLVGHTRPKNIYMYKPTLMTSNSSFMPRLYRWMIRSSQLKRLACFHRSSTFGCRQNRLNLGLNPSKTQLIWFGSRQQLLKLDQKLIAMRLSQMSVSFQCLDTCKSHILSHSLLLGVYY